jgi:hypothetical protein
MAATFSKCPTCKRAKRADAPCIYCGRADNTGANVYAGLPAKCVNCGERRPAALDDGAASFRCFKCGAVNRPARSSASEAPVAPADRAAENVAHAAEPVRPLARDATVAAPTRAQAQASAARAKPAGPAPAKAHQLTLLQTRALEKRTWLSLGYVFWVAPLAIASLLVLRMLPWLLPFNPKPHVLVLLVAPLGLLVIATAWGVIRVHMARVALENLCAAIGPRDRGASARCYACGAALSTRIFVERCRACGTDNITQPGIVRRAKKEDAHVDWDAGRPIPDEIAFRCDALERARGSARRATALLPVLALVALGTTAWAEGWKLPATDKSKYAVVTSPDCNMVITASGPVRDGYARTDMSLRGAWVKEELPLAYNQTFRPPEFVNKRALMGPQPGLITSVYRTIRDPEIRMLVDVGGGRKLETPLLRSCLEEKHPYRNAERLTVEDIRKREKKKLDADDRERRIQQAQLHQEEPLPGQARKGSRRRR